MRRITCLFLGLAPLPAWGAPAPADYCREAPLPPEPWTSWGQSGVVLAGGEVGTAPRITLGKPVVATLRPQAQVQSPAKPQPPIKGQGGLFTLALKDAARVGIALSEAAASVDIVTDNLVARPVDHGHGPDCSGIAKIVWFELPAGLHVVAVWGASGRELRIMAADARANRAALKPAPHF